MKKKQNQSEHQSLRSLFSAKAFRRGSYSAVLCVVVIAIAVVLSLLVSMLPDDVKLIDLTGDSIYQLGDTTRGVLDGLTQDVTLTVIAETGTVDPRIERLLGEYTAASSRVKVEYRDPVANPSVLTEYGVEKDTIVVTADGTDKTDSILLGNFIGYDQSSYYYYGQLVETEFDGEGQLTSAIHAVTGTTADIVYLLNGHGEVELAATISDRIAKLSLETKSLNLLTDGSIPEDCSLLLIHAPAGDLADDELALLRAYLAKGGKLLYVGSFADAALPNFDALLLDYGFQRADGYIADLQNYYQDNYYNMFPQLDTERPPVSGLPSDSQILVYDALGYTVVDAARDTIGSESFLTTGEYGYAVTSDGQTQGSYTLGGYATEETDGGTAKLAFFSAPTMIEESLLTSFSSLANADVFMSTLTWFLDGVEDVSIPAKSLQVTQNTVNGGGIYAALFIGVIPAALLAGGFVVWLRRRKA